ncbi:hypothetical protein PGQ11_003377 [Apiospora arundinis]|uniref:Rhodopsin domain-containing protein n=1 Tax=Apiospora arundinis TaxID=335852 RepID=A0ABR2J505_9PEZI
MVGSAELVANQNGAYDNLNEPQPSWNRRSHIIAITVSVQALTCACAGARLYSRAKLLRSLWWDDCLVLAVLICCIIGSTITCISTSYGMGQHVVDISYMELANFLLLHYIGMGTFIMSSVCVKLALLFQYIRILPGESRMMRVCQGLIAFTMLYGLVISFMAWFPCFPPVAQWDISRQPGNARCYGFGASTASGLYDTFVTVTGTNVVLNVVILLVVTPLYFRKGVDTRLKVGLTAMLIMGGFVNSMAIWRIIHVYLMAAKSGTYPTFDPTWYAPTTVMLAVLEVNGATVCASIPLAADRLSRLPPTPPTPPALGSKGIMVTRDVRIEHSPRYSFACEKHVVVKKDCVLDEPWTTPSHCRAKSECSYDSSHMTKSQKKNSCITIEVEDLGCCEGEEGMNSHYRDSFIRSQVDPLNPFGRVRSVITAGPAEIF